ncbi:MAG TPA: HD domain-containing phosphohydrolase [Pyrinomonadaceae bacterium]|nr:HD domain-containing phosphohydrolase [Pyrinomonadaceae bacterium]
MERVLCVDDEQNILEGYQRSLRKDFRIDIANGGAAALEMIRANGPYAVIVSDMRMPEMDGVQLLAAVKEVAPETVRIMLTGNADQQTAIEAVNEGNIFRFLNKPCPPESLKNSLLAAIKQYHLIHAEKELLEKTLTGSLQVLTDILSMVNPTAFGRAARVRRLVRELGANMKLDNVWQVEIAAMLSQIGCITVPEETLAKVYEGKVLTADEKAMIANHAKVAHDLIARIPRLEPVAEIIGCQDRVGDENEPEAARVLRLALDFDKLIEGEKSSSQAFSEIETRVDRYGASAIEALRDVVAHSETMYQQRAVTVDELAEQMILAADVVATNGVLLIGKGQEATASLKMRLWNFVNRGSIEDQIHVFIPIQTPGYRRETAKT